METISDEIQGGFIVLALATEEATILLQPGALFRTVMGREPDLRSGVRFLTFRIGAGGMLAALPQAAAMALLAEPAGHPVERELQEHLFACLTPLERGSFFAGDLPASAETFLPPHPSALAVDDEN